MTFDVWSTTSPPQKRRLIFSRQELIDNSMGRSVSNLLFWAFFEIFLVTILEPHAGRIIFTDFYTLDNYSCVRRLRELLAVVFHWFCGTRLLPMLRS